METRRRCLTGTQHAAEGSDRDHCSRPVAVWSGPKGRKLTGRSYSALVEPVFEYFGADDIHPGDVFFWNDPYNSSGGIGHIPDLCTTVPIFYGERLIGFSQVFGHHDDVGGSVPGGPVELSLDEWQGQLDFNLTSAFLACKHAIPHMERQGGGAIVNISSIAGLRHIGNDHVGYAASKAGLVQFGRALAVYAGLQ